MQITSVFSSLPIATNSPEHHSKNVKMLFAALLILVASSDVLFTTANAYYNQRYLECTTVGREPCSCTREILFSQRKIIRKLGYLIENATPNVTCNCCDTPRCPLTECPCTTFETDNLPLPCCSIGTAENPADSCRDLAETCTSCADSGHYWIRNNPSDGTVGDAVLVYCDMEVHNDTRCGGSRGWMRVANLDMNNTQCNTCPSPLITISSPTNSSRRLCTRVENRREPGCASVPYGVQGVEYSRVCGRVIGYQREAPDAFKLYNEAQLDNPPAGVGDVTIDDEYVDGVSITHGQCGDRTHIWTFAAAKSESQSPNRTCPCISGATPPGPLPLVPPYVGRDFFCDTASQLIDPENRTHFEDPLWDGEGCGPGNTCCQFNAPPYFRREIEPTTDDIDVRLCAFFRLGRQLVEGMIRNREDTPLEVIELYVQ